MIAINCNTRSIAFKTGMTDKEKYSHVKNLWYYSNICLYHHFPKFLYDYKGDLIPIPDKLYFERDINYETYE